MGRENAWIGEVSRCMRRKSQSGSGRKEREKGRGREKSLGDPNRGEENVSAWRIRLLGGRKWPRRLPFWNSRTRHVNFLLRGKVCYEEADTNEFRKKGNMKCTHPQASSEIDEVADEKDTRPGRLFSRLFVHHRSGIAHPSTPSFLVTDETGRRIVHVASISI